MPMVLHEKRQDVSEAGAVMDCIKLGRVNRPVVLFVGLAVHV